MQKILIFLLLFLLGGCSINSLILGDEIDRVYVVRYTSYVKHYRAYFQRSHLHTIQNGKKYRYFYNKESNDLAILLHPDNKYVLYSFSHPGTVINIPSDRKHGYRHILNVLKRKGYRVTTPHNEGYTTKVALRRYKKVKTLLVEVKDYQHLQSLYKEAIKTYNAEKIKKIKTRLPKVLIESYYKKYEAQATTQEQLEQLKIIASKLHLHEPVPRKEQTHQEEKIKEENIADNVQDNTENLYNYYLNYASYDELNNYLSTSDAESVLSSSQYNNLTERNDRLKEKNLLQNGSLEELITAYKKNKDPRYKSKIMQRIKEIQQSQ